MPFLSFAQEVTQVKATKKLRIKNIYPKLATVKLHINQKNETIMNDVITKEALFNHPIDKVWNAISKAEEISTWFIKADFKAEKGYKYTFTSEPNEKGCTTISGEVKEANPYTLVYTWIVADTKVETTVKWKLETTPNGTKLLLEHSGISNYQGETAIKMFESFNGGWNNCIKELLAYLKTEIHAG
ncbi:SRPBCC family protein [Aestuariivivens insulae]|uniref:SRPBCC family protein n=1 Tax=Aestuariivivens insulae TaxID=1621988 RepID=UPI001F5AD329|nr:SRPBCC domain-containing protein [Aestuariivivens insulae]